MKFDKTTLKVTDFEDIDKDQLYKNIKCLIFKGRMTMFLYEVTKDFKKCCNLTNDQFLTLQSNTFPLRILHGLIESGFVKN